MRRLNHNMLSIALASLLLLTPTLTTAEQGRTSVGVTAEYTTGDYGTADTTRIWYLPLSIGYETSRSLFKVIIPYIIVEGTGEVVVTSGGHHVVKSQTTTRVTTESGLGDILLSARYTLLPETARRPLLDLTARIKLATADEARALGTGENDLALQMELAKTFRNTTLYGGIGKKFLGDPPGSELNDILYSYIGAEYLLDDKNIVGLAYDYGEAITDTGSGVSEVTFYINNRVSRQNRLNAYLLMGLSDGSPDWGVGIGMVYYSR